MVLALDAAAVAAARAVTGLRPREALTLALVFGGFQGGMAALGWAAGAASTRWLEAWDHWVAFAVLVVLGLRMVVRRPDAQDARAALSVSTMIALGVATSLDALAAGITLPLLSVHPGAAIALIAAVAAALTLAGARAGAALGARLGRGLEVAGGLALCGIGAKILVEHLT